MRILAKLSDDDRRFLADFETGKLVADDFHHRDHLRAAWATLGTYPLLEALARYTQSIKALAAAAGQPGIYHQTITWAYMLLIHERLAKEASAEALSWEAFAERNRELFAWRPSILDEYYGDGMLASPLSRETFVLPQISKPAPSGRLP